MSPPGPKLPTCALHQSRQLSEVLRTCESNRRHGPFLTRSGLQGICNGMIIGEQRGSKIAEASYPA